MSRISLVHAANSSATRSGCTVRWVIYCLEHGLQLARFGNVARQEQRHLGLAGERFDEGFCFVVQIGHGQIGPGIPEMLGRRPGKAVLVGDADHKAFSALQIDDFYK